MVKKTLILALALNTLSMQSSQSSTNHTYDFAGTCAITGIVTVAGIICTWLACKDFKKGWQATKELDRHLKILNEMGIEVYKVSKGEVQFGSFVIKEHYTMNIPSNFCQEQEKKAKEHWNLLLTNDKYANNMLGWFAVASVLLIPTGIAGIVECIQLSGFDFNKN